MGRTTALRSEIKRVFAPHLASKGFAPDPRHLLCYRRIDAEEVHVCDIQWDKYDRPRFVLNFGKAPAAGLVDVTARRHFAVSRPDLGEAYASSWRDDGKLVSAGSPFDRTAHRMVATTPTRRGDFAIDDTLCRGGGVLAVGDDRTAYGITAIAEPAGPADEGTPCRKGTLTKLASYFERGLRSGQP
jgi:hypothetical protein